MWLILPKHSVVLDMLDGFSFFLMRKNDFSSTQIRNALSIIDTSVEMHRLNYITEKKTYHLLTTHLVSFLQPFPTAPWTQSLLANFIRQCTSNWIAFVETNSRHGDDDRFYLNYFRILMNFGCIRSRYFAVRGWIFTVRRTPEFGFLLYFHFLEIHYLPPEFLFVSNAARCAGSQKNRIKTTKHNAAAPLLAL